MLRIRFDSFSLNLKRAKELALHRAEDNVFRNRQSTELTGNAGLSANDIRDDTLYFGTL